MKKLWSSHKPIDQLVESFSIGQDQTLDLQIAYYDIIGSIAHAKMLAKTGLISSQDEVLLKEALLVLLKQAELNELKIGKGIEDIHSQIELCLIEKLGDIGKKIHTARSRNDQVLLDLKLFFRAEIEAIAQLVQGLFQTLQKRSEQHKDHLLPGYTHLQMAMVSSFGLWFGAFAESLADDLQLLRSTYKIVNQNPLGSAAGYGTSLPIDRGMTTDLLGFEDLSYNVVHAQMGRGKTEWQFAIAMAGIAQTVGKLAMDVCLYMNPGFGYLHLPDQLTTGSSIMPHKKNPDIFELVRGRCNLLQTLPANISALGANLPSGYHREFQLLKEQIFPAIQHLKDVLNITTYGLEHMEVNTTAVNRDQQAFLFTVEAVNDLVREGIPFRTAYGRIAEQVKAGSFQYEGDLEHSHEGSLGNLCTDAIKKKFDQVFQEFHFEKQAKAIKDLVEPDKVIIR